jgi:osmotically-inducible protein OsmY
MTDETGFLARIRDVLRADTRIRFDEQSLTIALSQGDLVMEGEVADVSVKRRALRCAAEVIGNRAIVDRIRVRPAEPMADGMVRDLVRDALLQEPALSECGLREWDRGTWKLVRDPPQSTGSIDMRVEDGVVTLDGEVPGLGRKRLAGVLAWWVPGSRDVVNGLAVTPPEADSDDEITDALRLVLEKDPFVDAGQIRAVTDRGAVTLTGLVRTDAERDLAEHDAWYVFGVEDVANRIEVRA